MEVRIEDVSPIEKKLLVNVPWKTVSGKITDAYKELAKTVSLKGFRKGKVPRSVLERMFGDRVKAEVTTQLIRESFMAAATEHNLDAVSEPKLEEAPALKKGQDVAFEATVEVRGEVVAKDYEGMELNKRPLSVSDDQLSEAIEQIRREHTELLPVEDRDTMADTDVVSLSCKGTVGEHQIDRPQLVVDLGDTDREPLPGLAAALIGLKTDLADHELEIKVPDDHSETEIAGAEAKLTITVLDVRQKEVPELDDEFAKDTGKAETFDELKGNLKADLEKVQSDEIQAELRNAALDELVKRNQIPVAKALIDRVVHSKWHRLQRMMGIEDNNHEHRGFTDEIREKLAEGADDEVRGQLLVEALAEQEKIEVSDEELDSRIAKMSEMRGGMKPAKLRAELDKGGQLDSLRHQVRHEMALDHLIAKATVTEKEPEPEPEPEAAAE